MVPNIEINNNIQNLPNSNDNDKVSDEIKINSLNEDEKQDGQINEKTGKLRGKKGKKIINTMDKMEDNDQIEEIREQNEEQTKQVPGKVDEKQNKCKCLIF